MCICTETYCFSIWTAHGDLFILPSGRLSVVSRLEIESAPRSIRVCIGVNLAWSGIKKSCDLPQLSWLQIILYTEKPVFKGQSDERTPCDQGTLSSHIKEPTRKGHLSSRDTLSKILRCPFKRGFNVHITMA